MSFQKTGSWVGSIPGNDRITDIHVHNLLRSKGIPSVIEGSVIYGIAVPPSQSDEALRILRNDPQNRGYISESGEKDAVKRPEKKKVVSRLRVEEALARSMFATNTQLGIFLRSREIRDLTRKYPFITYFSIHERKYLNTTNALRTGYDVEITLSEDGSSSGYRGWYQVYDDGREIVFQGANEWSGRKSE